VDSEQTDLAKHNGKEGQSAYVAVNGKIFDVTSSRLWKNGKHMNRHEAGQDLTTPLAAAPHGPEVLDKFAQIGNLKVAPTVTQIPLPGWLVNFLEANPFFMRHPHPMIVHFPMVFYFIIPLFLLWYYLVQPLAALLDTIFYLHILGTLVLPGAMATGWLSWQVNYFGKPIQYISRKIGSSVLLLVLDLIVLVALLLNRHLLVAPVGFQWSIPILILLYLPIVSFIGQQGGMLVYPVHKK
jgi:predicted heme/steroid binding protein/uncharacterized membrane protein